MGSDVVKKVLLETLADGEFHSGQQLGSVLGVSRTAVWKHMQRLRRDGAEIECVRGKGYRLLRSMPPLQRDRIVSRLSRPALALLREIEVHDSVTSTNSLALAAGRHGYACLAEQQTGGRGRLGRRWVSPRGKNIYLSLVYEFARGAAALEGLSLAVGLALVEALAGEGVDGLELKWPNDLVWRGRKVAGILLELSGDPQGPCQVVAGIGINVHMSAADGAGIDQPWVSLDEVCGGALDRNRLVAVCLNRLAAVLALFELRGFAPLRSRWQSLDYLYGRSVVLSVGERRFTGIARGVDDRGHLLLETPLGMESFSGGEVSARMAA